MLKTTIVSSPASQHSPKKCTTDIIVKLVIKIQENINARKDASAVEVKLPATLWNGSHASSVGGDLYHLNVTRITLHQEHVPKLKLALSVG